MTGNKAIIRFDQLRHSGQKNAPDDARIGE
jgi:hypothetical protein